MLLEPLEYKEVRRLSDLVIDIDTSGSCSGEIVRRFLEETWSILNTEGQFFRKMNLHVIQCDCVIQEHEQITCEEEWKEYLDKVTVKGGGGYRFYAGVPAGGGTAEKWQAEKSERASLFYGWRWYLSNRTSRI